MARSRDEFYQASLTLVLQVTNAGVTRPGNEARILTKEPSVKWKVMSQRWTSKLLLACCCDCVCQLFSTHNGSNSLVLRIALPFEHSQIL